MNWNAFELCSGCLKHLGKVRHTASSYPTIVISTASAAIKRNLQAAGASHALRGSAYDPAMQCRVMHVCDIIKPFGALSKTFQANEPDWLCRS